MYQNFVNAYEETFESHSKNIARVLINLARLKSGDKVLDAGCGTGTVAEILIEYQVLIHGIDLSPSMISRANSRNLVGCMFEKGDCLNLQYPTGYFDIYLGNLIINNVKNPDLLLTEAKRVLKTGGNLLISYPIYKRENDVIKIMKSALRDVKIGSRTQKACDFKLTAERLGFKDCRLTEVAVGVNFRNGEEACRFLSPLKDIKQLEKIKKKEEVFRIIQKNVDLMLSRGSCIVFEVCVLTASNY